MSLQYIIDAYNIIHHAKFRYPHKRIKDSRSSLLEFIRFRRLTGSTKNKITLVFDGYPDKEESGRKDSNIEIIFSKDKTADERIKKIVETARNPKNIIVVSDDKEIRFFVKAAGAHCLNVEEFINPQEKIIQLKRDGLLKPELTYSQIHKINQEFKKLWLK